MVVAISRVRWVGLLLVIILLATTLAGCRLPKHSTPPPPGEQNGAEPGENRPGPGQEDPQKRIQAEVAAWLDYLTLEEKVGQLLWVGLPGTELSAESQELLDNGQVGGLILFGRQGSDPATLVALTGGAQQAAANRERSTPGLLISIDHEGGLVQRFGPPFTQWPGNMALGATRSTHYAEAVARAMARELRAVGININLAPDADVNNNPANPVIGIRSFGEEPALVARLVSAQIRGFQEEKIGAVSKHFPGHGDTDIDSHLALPTVAHPMERLEQVELLPFQEAIAAEVDGIMAAHVVFPAVATDGLPATLSPQVLTGLLKEQMGYEGVVVTDAIDTMKAITSHWGVEQAMIKAVQAGADVLLVTESFGVQRALHQILVKAVAEGLIPEGRIEDGARRVLTLKARRGLLPTLAGGQATGTASGAASGTASGVTPAAGPGAALSLTEGDRASIGAPAHKELATQVGADALTLVRQAHLPFTLSDADQVLVVGAAYGPRVRETEGVLTPLGAGIRQFHTNVREVALVRRPDASAVATVRSAAAQATAIVYGVYNGQSYPEHLALIRELIATGKPVVVVGMGMPYELTEVPEIETYIAAYGYQEPNLQGVGALLFGKAEAKGKLPVSIPGLYPVGHGLAR